MIRHRSAFSKTFGRLLLAMAVVSLVVGVSTTTHAALLPVGGQIAPTSEAYDPAAMMELESTTAPFLGIGFSGTVTSRVFTNDASNPFGADRLTFSFQVNNAADSVHVLHRFSANEYTGFMTDVSFGGDGTVPPSQADRTTADVVGFNFIEAAGGGAGLITPGSQSRVMVIQTDATAYAPGIVSLINGGVSTVASFRPVPEPGTWILAAIGVLGVGGLVRRARRQA